MQPDELTQVKDAAKEAVREEVAKWPHPPAAALGRIWIISVSALALATLAIVGALIIFLWTARPVTELMSLATLLLGAFIGWLGGSKANPAP